MMGYTDQYNLSYISFTHCVTVVSFRYPTEILGELSLEKVSLINLTFKVGSSSAFMAETILFQELLCICPLTFAKLGLILFF